MAVPRHPESDRISETRGNSAARDVNTTHQKNCQNRVTKRKPGRPSSVREEDLKTMHLRNGGQDLEPGKRAQKRRTTPAPTVGAGFGVLDCARKMAAFPVCFLEL